MSIAEQIKTEEDENWGVKAVRSVLAPGGHSRKLPFARTLGLSLSVNLISVAWGEVTLEWDAAAGMNSMNGIIQGGILTVIADYAQGHCFSTTLDAPQGFSTIDFQTRYLRLFPSGRPIPSPHACWKNPTGQVWLRPGSGVRMANRTLM